VIVVDLRRERCKEGIDYSIREGIDCSICRSNRMKDAVGLKLEEMIIQKKGEGQDIRIELGSL